MLGFVRFYVVINGAKLTGGGQLWQVADSDLRAYNEYGKKPQVVIEEKKALRYINWVRFIIVEH